MGVLPHVTLVLSENNSIITESESVAKIFNKYFNEIAEGIGFNDPIPENLDKDDILLSMIKRYDDHPSIMAIKRFSTQYWGQSFGIVNPDSEKSTGYDGIPAKLLKVGAELLSVMISKLTNMSIGELHDVHFRICLSHHCDVIMGVVASQISSLTIVYSTVYSDADQRI